jgi:formylglycine-generating enzyme required for sulfatase activity
MGSPRREAGRDPDETLHCVTLTRPFWMAVFPVTQAQLRAVTGITPSVFRAKGRARENVAGLDTDDFPADSVTWAEAVAFCQALGRRKGERASGNKYRLPTEAEWEYSCRAGLASGRFHFGKSLRKSDANTERSGLGRPCPVGQYPPNAFGLHDMHGNVAEWCADWYGEIAGGDEVDPHGPRLGEYRLLKGGSWQYDAADCRSAARDHCLPTSENSVIGFRVVRVPAEGRRP